MSKRNRRPDKGRPGSRAPEKIARAVAVARREAEQAAAAALPEQQARAVAETMAALADLPAGRWRAPYSPAVSDWAARWGERNGFWSNDALTERGHPDDLDWVATFDEYRNDLAEVIAIQPEESYEGVAYGMTGAGESIMDTLAAEADRFHRRHGHRITDQDTPDGLGSLPQRVLAAADTLSDEWLDPAFCGAYVATGYLVTEDTRVLFTDEEVETWTRQVRDFRASWAAAYGMGQPEDLPASDEWVVPTILHPALGEEFAERLNESLAAG